MTKNILEKAAKNIVGNYTEKAQEEWDKMVKKYILENQSIHSIVTVEATDNWIEYTLRYVVDYKKRREVKNELVTSILKDIDNTNGVIQFASTTIEIRNDTNIDSSRY